MQNVLTRTIRREIGPDQFRIRSDATAVFHPITMHLGPAAVVLTRSEALHLARAFVDAAQFLPKG